MASTSTNDSVSILRDGKLKPGIYKIRNVTGQTYIDIRDDNKELCCRPATLLEGKGLVCLCPRLAYKIVVSHFQWEILPSGLGYTIRRVQH